MTRRVCTSVFVFVCLLAAGRADAASLTFVFDCTVQNTEPATCPINGSFGSITLSDSLVNPNRVDLIMSIAQPAAAGVTDIGKIYLNYNNAITVGGNVDRRFGVVSTSAAAGDRTALADIDLNLNNLGPFYTTLDLEIDPNGNPGMTFAGSLVIYSTRANLNYVESDLDVSMFDLRDANSLLWAAFTTLPANQDYEYGARTEWSADAAVPEPATLAFVGFGLYGLASRLRRSQRRRAA